MSHPTYEEILHFWFEETVPELWFESTDAFDKLLKERFERISQQAKAGELWHWRESLEGRLAEIIVLDQFSRNIYRGTSQAFSSDDMALVLAQEALKQEGVGNLEITEKQFLYMPFMHSESLEIHEKFAMPLFAVEGLEKSFAFEKEHKKQIERFGRYPFRNEALHRVSTPEELEFMSKNENF